MISLDDKVGTEGHEVSNLFKDFFSSVYSSDCLKFIEKTKNLNNHSDIIPLIQFSRSDIFNCIFSLDLDLNPCSGLNGIPNIITLLQILLLHSY